MSLTPEERRTVVTLELEKADSLFSQTAELKRLGYWDTLANRLYYAAFHAVLALLINDGHNVSTHKGAVTMLGLNYVRTGVIPDEQGTLYSQLQSLRERSDYNCSFSAQEKEVEPLIEPTARLIETLRTLVNPK